MFRAMKHVFIVNPAAGKSDRTESYRKLIDAAFVPRGLQYELLVSQAPGDCRKLAQQAFPVEHRRKAVFGLPAGNRAARRDEQHLPRHSYMISHGFFFLSSKLTILLCVFCVRSQGKH